MASYTETSAGISVTGVTMNPNFYRVKVIRTKRGWVAQIHIGPSIAWESRSTHKNEPKALREADRRVAQKLEKVFA